MKTSLILTCVFGALAVIFLIVTPITSSSMWTVITYKNETKYVIIDKVIPNRTMEDISMLSSADFTDSIQIPGAFESSYTTQVNVTYNQPANTWSRIKQSVHSKKPAPLEVDQSVFSELSYSLDTTKTLQDVEYNSDNTTVSYR